jgi:hypothetical protein
MAGDCAAPIAVPAVPVSLRTYAEVDTQPRVTNRLMDKIAWLRDQEYDDIDIAPSAYAIRTAEGLINDATYGVDWSTLGWRAGTDFDGGIFVVWESGDRKIRIEIPADSSNTPYICWSIGDVYTVQPGITHKDIVMWYSRLSVS